MNSKNIFIHVEGRFDQVIVTEILHLLSIKYPEKSNFIGRARVVAHQGSNNLVKFLVNLIGLTQNPEILHIVKSTIFKQPSEPMDSAALAACNRTACLS